MTLLPVALGTAARALFVGDPAAVGVVFALPDADGRADRFVAVHRALAPTAPGDFTVVGTFASDDAAALANTNYGALTDAGRDALGCSYCRTGAAANYGRHNGTGGHLKLALT